MNATTPPKLMPSFHSAAASGTLPIEQTKLMIATNGPTIAFSIIVSEPWPCRNTAFQKPAGTARRAKPAATKPMTISRRSMVRSAICSSAASAHRGRCRSRPAQCIRARVLEPVFRVPWCPGARGLRFQPPRAASVPGPRDQPGQGQAEQGDHDGPADELGQVNCQPISSHSTMPSSATRLVEANMNTIAAVKSAPRWNSDLASALAAYEHDELAMPQQRAAGQRPRARGRP